MTSLAWWPGGNRLASAGSDGTVKVWDTATGQEIITLSRGPQESHCVAWSPDGRRLAAASDDGSVKLWDASSGFEFANGFAYPRELARRAYNQKDFSTSVALLRNASAQFPSVPQYRQELAQSLFADRRHDEAIAVARKLANDFPGVKDYRRDLAQYLDAVGQPQEALAIFRKLAADSPDVVEYQFGLGQCLIHVGRHDEAANLFERLRSRFPDTIPYRDYQLGLVIARVAAGQIGEAKALVPKPRVNFTHAPGHLRHKGDFFTGRAEAERERTALDKALVDVNHSIWIYPGRPEAYFVRGWVYQRKRELAKAIREYTVAILMSPAPWYYQWRARAYGDQGDWERAVADLIAAIELKPDAPGDYLNNLAWLLATCPEVRIRDPARALALAEKAVRVAPQEHSYLNTLGAARYRAGDWSGSTEALKKSMASRDGGSAFDWFFLAMAHWQLGHKEEARRWFDKAVGWTEKNAPNDEELVRFRAEAQELLDIQREPSTRKERPATPR